MLRNMTSTILATFVMTFWTAWSIAQESLTHIHEGISDDFQVELWVNRGEASVYNPGDQIRVHFRPTQSCYVLVYSIDTEGFIRILYPYDYDDEPFVHAGKTIRVPDGWDHHDLLVSGPSGIQYIVAVAGVHPIFVPQWPRYYEGYYEPAPGLIDHICGDPYEGMYALNQYVIPDTYRGYGWTTSSTYFYVEQRVWYPRYMCYDCHWPRPAYFHPYMDVCAGFQIVIVDHDWYDDWAYWRPHYIPSRHNRGFWNVRQRDRGGSASHGDDRYSRRRGFQNIGFSKADVQPVNREEARQQVSRGPAAQPTIRTEIRRGPDQTDRVKSTRGTSVPQQKHERIETAPAPRQDAVVPRETTKQTPAAPKTEKKKIDSASRQQRQFWEKITDQKKKADIKPDATRKPSASKQGKSVGTDKTTTTRKPSEAKETTPQKRSSGKSSKSETSDKRSKRQ